MENFEQSNRKTAEEALREMEGRIKGLKETIHKFYTELRFLDKNDHESKEKYEEEIKKSEEELVGLEKSCKQVAKTMNPDYVPPEEETIGTYKGEKKEITPMEEKISNIIKQVDRKLNVNSQNNAQDTEKILKNITDEIDTKLSKERLDDKGSSLLKKFENLIQEIEENEKSFKIHFPKLRIDDDKPVTFLKDNYEDTYTYLKNNHKKLQEKLSETEKEIEDKLID